MLPIVLLFIAGCAKGFNDGIMFHPEKYKIVSKYPNFFDKNISWKNKYKGGDVLKGERFWGSSRWFVWTTDAFHLFEMIQFQSCIIAAVLFANMTWDQNIAAFTILNLSRWAGFKVAYK